MPTPFATMTTTAPEQDRLRFPVGRFTPPATVTPADRARWIADLEALPSLLRPMVEAMDEARLDTPYRPGGWTVRQVVHHLPDSHANAFIRVKLALTEDAPTIKPYDEARWAELPDVRLTPVGVSLTMLEALHVRWVLLLRALRPEEWGRTFVHPEQGRAMSLDRTLALYAWHGRHHVAHVTALRERMGW